MMILLLLGLAFPVAFPAWYLFWMLSLERKERRIEQCLRELARQREADARRYVGDGLR